MVKNNTTEVLDNAYKKLYNLFVEQGFMYTAPKQFEEEAKDILHEVFLQGQERGMKLGPVKNIHIPEGINLTIH